MIQPGKSDIKPAQLVEQHARLLRLARYRALQLSFERDRRQTIARSRLLRLHRDNTWGWVAL